MSMWKGDMGNSMLNAKFPNIKFPIDFSWVKGQIYEADIKLERYIDMNEPRTHGKRS